MIPDETIPTSYASWRHCIEKECGLALTPTYIATRLAALRDERDAHTREFRRIYGEPHLRAVIGWFERAETEAVVRN
jgi:hypothetical protein